MDENTRRRIARNVNTRRYPFQRLALQMLATGGTLTLAAVAPNVLGAVLALDPKFKKDKRAYRRLEEAWWRMERKGLITPFGPKKSGKFELTAKGNRVVDSILAEQYRIPAPIRWDGRWRVVMFDVPEKKRRVRDELRALLMRAGFLRLHDSVWVHPYPCDDFVLLVRSHLKNSRGEVHYLSADFFESDRWLRRHFNLD